MLDVRHAGGMTCAIFGGFCPSIRRDACKSFTRSGRGIASTRTKDEDTVSRETDAFASVERGFRLQHSYLSKANNTILKLTNIIHIYLTTYLHGSCLARRDPSLLCATFLLLFFGSLVPRVIYPERSPKSLHR